MLLVAWLTCTASASAEDYWWKVGASINWSSPSFVLWGAAGYPHGGHWLAIGYPPEIFHPHPWFLLYPPTAGWPTTAGWTPYTLPAPNVAGWTYTYPSAGLSGYPLWPTPSGASGGAPADTLPPLGQLPNTAWPAVAAPSGHVPTSPISSPTINWQPGQPVPYYWLGR